MGLRVGLGVGLRIGKTVGIPSARKEDSEVGVLVGSSVEVGASLGASVFWAPEVVKVRSDDDEIEDTSVLPGVGSCVGIFVGALVGGVVRVFVGFCVGCGGIVTPFLVLLADFFEFFLDALVPFSFLPALRYLRLSIITEQDELTTESVNKTKVNDFLERFIECLFYLSLLGVWKYSR